MSDSARYGLWLIAGGYLAYNGISLFRDAMQERPEHYILYSAVGVLFILFGIFLVIQAVKRLRNREETGDQSEEGAELPGKHLEISEERPDSLEGEEVKPETENKDRTDGE